MGSKKIYIFALAAAGQGISGGDRIFIEFAKNWSKRFPVTIYLWEEGYQMCKRAHLDSHIKFLISKMGPWKNFGFFINYIARIIEGVRLGLTLKIEDPENTMVYSASEFWMDSLAAFILKLRYQKIVWAAAWYQTAPNPLEGFSGFLPYWLVQLPIKPLIDRFANFVLVNNDLEKKVFKKLDRENKAIVVLGAIDLKEIKKWQKIIGKKEKIYDCVFQGRFHPQKGVLEMIDIWARVIGFKKDAKLIMIGDGPLMQRVKDKVKREKLEKNIELTGYLFDGEEKYKIFVQSKIVVHPAIFDSGGMASAEAMAFGLPAVGFNLSAYQYYYPKGMIKVPIKDLDAFAKEIIMLLSDEKFYKKVSKEVLQFINDTWSWEYRSRQILQAVLK